MTAARFMVWSQQSTCLLIIASSKTTVIPQQFASRLAYPSAPWRLLQASNWAQLDFYWGHSFHHQAGETFRGERSPFKLVFQVKDLVLKKLTPLTYMFSSTSSSLTAPWWDCCVVVGLHCFQGNCWLFGKGWRGQWGHWECICACLWGGCYCCWRQEVRALSANSGNLNVGLRQRTKRQLLAI